MILNKVQNNNLLIRQGRKVNWIFAVYSGIELIEIFKLTPKDLEPYYIKWERKWHADGKKDINNPKIPLSHVRKTGTLLYEIKAIFKDV